MMQGPDPTKIFDEPESTWSGTNMPRIQNVYPTRSTDKELTCNSLRLQFQAAQVGSRVEYKSDEKLHITVFECRGGHVTMSTKQS